MVLDKPYLIIPKLIEQPTWGGKYIINFKNWGMRHDLSSFRIGQSYELTGESLLSLAVDSESDEFQPELQLSTQKIITPSVETIPLSKLIKANPAHNVMPLLIKFTQALGNSFQLHIKPGIPSSQWKPKPESWYFFEKGFVTLGVKKGMDKEEYKHICSAIEEKMKQLSALVKTQKMTLTEAQKEASLYIHQKNPWQFVNRLMVEEGSCIDLSSGGIHHSWEENETVCPKGNIIYEVQQDVDDTSSTIRSFDQGKFKEDGSIRTIHIDDYFTFLDTDEAHNDPGNLVQKKKGTTVFHTPYYQTDELSVSSTCVEPMPSSFVHLFIKDGTAIIQTEHGSVRVTQGHSCFIPCFVGQYTINSETPNVTVLKTYVS